MPCRWKVLGGGVACGFFGVWWGGRRWAAERDVGGADVGATCHGGEPAHIDPEKFGDDFGFLVAEEA